MMQFGQRVPSLRRHVCFGIAFFFYRWERHLYPDYFRQSYKMIYLYSWDRMQSLSRKIRRYWLE